MPKLIANLGDVHPIDYGGFFVYDDGSVEVYVRGDDVTMTLWSANSEVDATS